MVGPTLYTEEQRIIVSTLLYRVGPDRLLKTSCTTLTLGSKYPVSSVFPLRESNVGTYRCERFTLHSMLKKRFHMSHHAI